MVLGSLTNFSKKFAVGTEFNQSSEIPNRLTKFSEQFVIRNSIGLDKFIIILHNIADKEGKDKEKEKNAALAVPRLSVCADAQKVDRAKLAQTEVRLSQNIQRLF